MHDITGKNMKISEVITSETVSEDTRKDELEQYPTNKLFVAKRNAPFEPLSTDVGQLSDTNKFVVNRKVKNDPVFKNKVSSIRNKDDIFDRRSYNGKDFVYFTLIPPVSLSIKGKKQFISNTDKSNTIASFNDSFIISSDFYNATTLPSVEFGVNSDNNNVNINIKHTSRKDLSTQNKNTSHKSSHSNNFGYFIKDKSQRISPSYNNSTIVSSTFGSNNISTEFTNKFKNLNVIDTTLSHAEDVKNMPGFNMVKRFDHDTSEIIAEENVAVENATLDNDMMVNNTDGLENLTRYSGDDILVDVNTTAAEVTNDSDVDIGLSTTSESIPVDDRNEKEGLTENKTHYNDNNNNFTSGESNITVTFESYDVTNENVTPSSLFSSADTKDETDSSSLQSSIINSIIDTFTPFLSAINETLSFDNSSHQSEIFPNETYIPDVNATFSFDGVNGFNSSSIINSSDGSEYETSSYLSEAATADIISTSNTIFIINESNIFTLHNMHANQNSEIAPTAPPSITENLFINSTAFPKNSFTFDNTVSFPDVGDTYLFFGMNDSDFSSENFNDSEEPSSSLLISITLSYPSDITSSISMSGSKTSSINNMHENRENDQDALSPIPKNLFLYSSTYPTNFFIYKSTTSLHDVNDIINEMNGIFNSPYDNFLSNEYHTLNSPSFGHSRVSENGSTFLDSSSVFEDYQTSHNATIFSFLSSITTYSTSTTSVVDMSEMFIFYNNQTSYSISPLEYDRTLTLALSVSSLSSTDSTASLLNSLPDNMHEILSSFHDSEDDWIASSLIPRNPSPSSTALPIINMSDSTTFLSDASKFLLGGMYDIFSSSNIYTPSKTDTAISFPHITSSLSIYSVNLSNFDVFPIENQVLTSTFPETLSSTSPIQDDRTKHIRFPISPGQTNRKFTQQDPYNFDSSKDSDVVKPTKSYFSTSEHSMVSTYNNRVYDKEIILSNERETIPELSSTDVSKLTSIASREMFNFKEDNSVLRSTFSTMDDLQSPTLFQNSADSDKTVSTLYTITEWFAHSSSEELDSVLFTGDTRASIILYETETTTNFFEKTVETITSSYRPRSAISATHRPISTADLAVQTIENLPLSTLENYNFPKSIISTHLPNIYTSNISPSSIFNTVSSFDENESDLTTEELTRFDKIEISTPIASNTVTLETLQEIFSESNDLGMNDTPEAQFSLRRPRKDVDFNVELNTIDTAILTSFELTTSPTIDTRITSTESPNFVINSEQIILTTSDLELVPSLGLSETVFIETTPYDLLSSELDTKNNNKFSSQSSITKEITEFTISTTDGLISSSVNERKQILNNFYTTEVALQSSFSPIPSTSFLFEFNSEVSGNTFKNSYVTTTSEESFENTVIYSPTKGKSSTESLITLTSKIETEENFTELSQNSKNTEQMSKIDIFSTVPQSSIEELISDTPAFSEKVSAVSSETLIITPSRTTNISPTAFIKSVNENSDTLQTEFVNVKSQNIPSSVSDEDKATYFSIFTKPITDASFPASLFTSPSQPKRASSLQDTFTKSITTESSTSKSESKKITDFPLNTTEIFKRSTVSINESKDTKQTTVLPVNTAAYSSASTEEESWSFTPIPYVEIPVYFKINADFKEVVGTREAQFKKSLRRQLAKIMRLPLDTIQNLTVREGSVEVNFHLVPSTSNGYPADEEVLKAASAELKRLINSNQLKLRDLNGNTLVVVAENPITTPAPVSPPDNTTTILGVILAIVLLIAIITFTAIMTKYRGTQKLSPLEEAKNDIPSYRKIPYENLLWAIATKPNASVGKFDYDSGVWIGPGSPPVFQAPEIPKYDPPTKSQIRKSVRPSTSTRRKLKQDWHIDDQTLFS